MKYFPFLLGIFFLLGTGCVTQETHRTDPIESSVEFMDDEVIVTGVLRSDIEIMTTEACLGEQVPMFKTRIPCNSGIGGVFLDTDESAFLLQEYRCDFQEYLDKHGSAEWEITSCTDDVIPGEWYRATGVFEEQKDRSGMETQASIIVDSLEQQI